MIFQHTKICQDSTKGAKACPICEDDTYSLRLRNCKKNVFMGHRRSIPRSHPYRKFKKVFDRKMEHGVVRPPLDGPTTYSRAENMNIVLRKGGTAPPKNIWKKGLFSRIYHIRSTCKYDIVLILCILRKTFVKVC